MALTTELQKLHCRDDIVMAVLNKKIVLLILFLSIGIGFVAVVRSQIRFPTEDERSSASFDCESDANGHFRYIKSKNITKFISRLNSLAGCNYRVVEIAKKPLRDNFSFENLELSAILEKDKDAFEYDWFEAFTPGEIQTRLDYRVEKGFYFKRAIIFVDGACKSDSSFTPQITDSDRIFSEIKDFHNTIRGTIIFLEKNLKNGESKSNVSYRTILGKQGLANDGAQDLNESLGRLSGNGFSPVALFVHKVGFKMSTSILLEKLGGYKFVEPKPDYEFLIASDGFERKLNRLTSIGYELPQAEGFFGHNYALVKKISNNSGVHHYKVVRSLKNKILNRADSRRLSLVTTGFIPVGCDFGDDLLLFENSETNNIDREIVDIDVNMSEKGVSDIINEKTSLGYELKALIHAYDLSLIFEKSIEE